MGFPNLKNKHSRGALFSPGDFMAYLKRVGRYPRFRSPHGMILCYQASLMDYILKKHKATRVRGIGGGDTYLLDETGGRVGVTGRFGIGAPAAVANLEELIAFGVKRFISVGTAGALRKGVNIGDLMVCDRAIRDEGTSYHYLKPSKYAYPSRELTDGIRAALKAGGLEFFSGTTWTVDAPYRETVAEVKKYQKEGVSTVEMEASALFAAAQVRRVPIATMFTISDSLADLEWTPQFHHKRTTRGLEALYNAALTVLRK
ncbi:MAG: nucleoside phosphorylase [Elusimicrobiales bacterium]|nr:nucleoside phosphorylase [Elusimicrobiales bacterium]